MKCPACGVETSVVNVDSHYGTPIAINQCPNCGGIWFDSHELYRVSPTEAKIDSVDINKIITQKEVSDEALCCPRDGEKLKIFKDVNFPKNLIIESYPVCAGFWFNQGEFKMFAEFREEKIKMNTPTTEKLNPELDSQISKLLALHSDADAYNALSTVGNFLSLPVQRSTSNPGRVNLSGSNIANLASLALTAILKSMISR